MTQWYQPRQLSSGPAKGKWRYTCSNTSGTSVYAVGACGDNCPGHDTAEEATRHYVDGLAAGIIDERDSEHSQKKCVECGEWTAHRVRSREDGFMPDIPICATHDARAAVKRELYERHGIGPEKTP